LSLLACSILSFNKMFNFGTKVWILLSALVGLSAAATIDGLPPKPAPCPVEWVGLIGKYGMENSDSSDFLVREEQGRLQIYRRGQAWDLGPWGRDTFLMQRGERKSGIAFARDSSQAGIACYWDDSLFVRKFFPGEKEAPPKPTLDLPLDSLWRQARRAVPPKERGRFSLTDLVDVRRFDPEIRLALAYAGSQNSYGFPLYDRNVALLQRPAARALACANRWLKERGYVLQLSDAYRPWYVTKFLHLSANAQMKKFVASPAAGSYHNRGTAVDVTLFDLAAGREADMGHLGGELSERAHRFYPGGTSLQRWHRLLLRTAMEKHGFRGLAKEWWHFRYVAGGRYRLCNRPLSAVAGE